VHVSALHQSNISALEDGQCVEFELTQLADGRTSAMGVRIIEASSDESAAP
jgi:cold shock CspA family protein